MRAAWIRRYRNDTYTDGVDPRWEVEIDAEVDDQPTIDCILDQLRAMELGLTE